MTMPAAPGGCGDDGRSRYAAGRAGRRGHEVCALGTGHRSSAHRCVFLPAFVESMPSKSAADSTCTSLIFQMDPGTDLVLLTLYVMLCFALMTGMLKLAELLPMAAWEIIHLLRDARASATRVDRRMRLRSISRARSPRASAGLAAGGNRVAVAAVRVSVPAPPAAITPTETTSGADYRSLAIADALRYPPKRNSTTLRTSRGPSR